MTTPDNLPQPLRLDDLFRSAVHLRPEVIFDLVAPDLVQGVRSAVSYTRLDTIDSTDAYLLGAISRVRFPKYAWTTTPTELLMNSAQNIEDSNVGHLTTRERRELQLQANVAARAELVRIKADERAAGERATLIEIALSIAPDRATELGAIENLDDLKREVMELVGNRD
jgi:hypothetical protein